MIGENFGRPIEIGISFSSNEDDITQYGVQSGMPAQRLGGRAIGVDEIIMASFPWRWTSNSELCFQPDEYR